MGFVYLTLEQAIDIHALTVDKSGGGEKGHLEIGNLESVLDNIQNDDYYPTFDAKLTHLFHSACKFHCFQDGNKRIAITLCVRMLIDNGYLRSINGFIQKSENISYHVAAGVISKELLGEWMLAILTGEEEDESLKLKILNAVTQESKSEEYNS